jgi:four helix bundle protein
LKEENIIRQKSYSFALRIIKAHKFLLDRRETILSKQLLRSGTSIGANIEEAMGAQSRRDFYMKLTIAYKEARESHYWIRLLRDGEYMEEKAAHSLLTDCEELLKIIGSIQMSVKKKNS